MLKNVTPRTFGIIVTVLGTLALTPDVILYRLTGVDAFTVAFWRGLFAGFTILFGCILVYKRNTLNVFKSLGKRGFLVAILQSIGMILFYVSLDHTSAANALIIYSTAPILAAVLSWFFLKEKVSKKVLTALAFVCFGVSIVATGSTFKGNITGDLIAFLNALSIAAFYVVVRGSKKINMIPALCLSFFIAAVISYPLALLPDLSTSQWVFLFISGVFMLPIAISLLTIGPRYLPAPEVSMINLLEVCIAPLLLWWIIGENPGLMSIIGGLIVVLALSGYALLKIRDNT